MHWFRKHKKVFILSIAGFFVFATFAGLGDYFLSRSPLDTAIVVGDQQIPYERVQSILSRALEQRRNASPQPVSEPERQFIRRRVVDTLIQEAIFVAEAERYGLRVTDNEILQALQAEPAFQTEGRFDPARYRAVLQQNRLTPESFERDQRRQMLVQKTQFLMASGIHLTSREWRDRVDQRLTKIDEVLSAGAAGLSRYPEENPRGADPTQVFDQLRAERETLRKDPASQKPRFRQREIQAAFQEWYTATQASTKVRMMLDRFEPETPPPTPADS